QRRKTRYRQGRGRNGQGRNQARIRCVRGRCKKKGLRGAFKIEERSLLGRQRGGDSKSNQQYQDEAFHLRSLEGKPHDRAGWPPINVNRRRGICLWRFANSRGGTEAPRPRGRGTLCWRWL